MFALAHGEGHHAIDTNGSEQKGDEGEPAEQRHDEPVTAQIAGLDLFERVRLGKAIPGSTEWTAAAMLRKTVPGSPDV